MKRLLLFGLSVICVATLVVAGTPGLKQPVEFTLAKTSGDPGPLSFTLATRLSGLLAGPGGAGPIEDSTNSNTALGWEALYSLGGSYNTAIGFRALYSVYSETAPPGASSGEVNTAVGASALEYNTTGAYNVAVGVNALHLNTVAHDNVAIGVAALQSNQNGYDNTACGTFALQLNTWGNYNTALGKNAGAAAENGYYNVFIGAHVTGLQEDTNTIRIGSPYNPNLTPPMGPAGQNRTFIAGIVETQLTADDTPSVVGITSEGRLGTMSSGMLPVSGSILILHTNIAAPSGYNFLGTTDIMLTQTNRKVVKVTYNVFQKQ